MVRHGASRGNVLWRLALLFGMQGLFLPLFFAPVLAATLNGQLETRLNLADISRGDTVPEILSFHVDTNLRLDLSGPVLSPERGGYQVSLFTAMDPPVVQGPYGDHLGKGSLRGLDVSTRLNPDVSGFGGEAAYRLHLKLEPPAGEFLPFWDENYGTSLSITPPGGDFSLNVNWQMDHQEDAVTGSIFSVNNLTRSMTAAWSFERGAANFSYSDNSNKDLTLSTPASFKSTTAGDLNFRAGEATDLALALRRTRYQLGSGGESLNNWSDSYTLQAFTPVGSRSRIIAGNQGTFTNVPVDQAMVRRTSLMLQSNLSDQWQVTGGVARETRWQTDILREEPRRIYQAEALGQPGENLTMRLYTSLDQPEEGGRIAFNPRQLLVGTAVDYDAGRGVGLSLEVENRQYYNGTYGWDTTEVKPGIRYEREQDSGISSSFSGVLTLDSGEEWQVRGREISGNLHGPLGQGYALDLTLSWKENLDAWNVWQQTGSVYAGLNRSFKDGGIASLTYRWGLSTTDGQGKSQEVAGRWSMPRGNMTYFAEAKWSSSQDATAYAVQETSWWVSSGVQLNF